MTVSKSRGATRKLGAISVGSKIVRFRVHNIDRRFAVHEDLICRTSNLFKAQLQKNRKALPAEPEGEECCVCQEDLDPITKDITYCVTCGQNVHDSCIEQWKQTNNTSGGDRTAATCPMCRATWKNEPLLKYLSIDASLDAEAVQAYLDYLYSGTLHIPSSISRRTDPFNVALLKCWAVASAVSDSPFKTTVINTFFTEAKARIWTDSVKWAFTDGQANEEIKDFVMEVFMAFMKPGWFKNEGAKWPQGFVRELADRAFVGMRGRKSYQDIKREWEKRVETEDADEGVEIVARDKILETKMKEAHKDGRGRRAVFCPKARIDESNAAASRTPALETNLWAHDELDWDLSRYASSHT
ncbi:hypothetical protein EK21DRAFT_58878 [Setomelanomma holmii]|uniref:RING-type domain-containing protein n=1 Tax=Setomelanomma holmii TaxID=210430 RepID=A0A9P4HHV1_9PLEO|nr:hypothetical protein EK21DRAFT_58878 [Setomelanomma holmii]